MKVKVYGPNLSRLGQDKGDMHVHRATCGHGCLYGPGKHYGGDRGDGWEFEAFSRKDVTFEVYADIMSDTYTDAEMHDHWQEYEGCLHFFSCLRGLP